LGILFVGLAMGLALFRVSLHFGPRNESHAYLPEYLIEPPDLLSVRVSGTDGLPLLEGEFIVGPDGAVNLGPSGLVPLAGCSINEARYRIRKCVNPKSLVTLKVVRYNSKVYYLIHDTNGTDEVIRMPFTGTDNVLDAIADFRDGNLSMKNIWISRPSPTRADVEILAVDFKAIATKADPTNNYQLLPGDRLFVSSKAVPASRW